MHMNKYCTRYDNHTIANAKQYCNIRITKYRVIYGINVVFECERARKCEREREKERERERKLWNER